MGVGHPPCPREGERLPFKVAECVEAEWWRGSQAFRSRRHRA